MQDRRLSCFFILSISIIIGVLFAINQKKQVYTATRVRVTFDGIPGETPDKFSLTGQAEGINLQIMDNYGYPARAGKSMPPLILRGNEDGLDYSLRIVRNGYPLKAGDYYAALRFKLDYE